MTPSTPLEPVDNLDAKPKADAAPVPPATSATTGDVPDFGWSAYAERVNGRFAMVGFSAVVLIEAFSRDSFLHWAGLVP
jgi:hypothetical protein